MATVMAAALVVCVVAIAVLARSVSQLRRELVSLDRRVAGLSPPTGQAPRSAGGQGSSPRQAAAPSQAWMPDGAGPAGDADTAPDQTVRVPVITDMADRHPRDVDWSVSRVASVALAGPLIKVTAFSHGLRRALDEDTRMRIGYAVRKELKLQRKIRRRRARRTPSKGWGR